MQTVRVSALNNRVPTPCSWSRSSARRSPSACSRLYLAILARGVITVVLAAVFVSVLLLVTFDLDRPTRGLVTVPDTPLVGAARLDGAAPGSPGAGRLALDPSP